VEKVAFHTLGCKVNQVETEQMKEEFQKLGYDIADFTDVADVYVINTCTVTHVSDRKCRSMIRRAVKRNPHAIVVAAGCGVQANPDQFAEIEGLRLVIGNKNKDQLAMLVDQYVRSGEKTFLRFVEPIEKQDIPGMVIYSHHHKRTRAFVKIQDGCQSFCSYCIVPMARGPVRSKRPEDVMAEIRQLVDLGYEEIVLTGIHTGFYGIDLENWNLNRLLRTLLQEVDGDYRIRLSSIEPRELTDELLDFIALEPRICRHLHIPLQSGSDRVLQSMGRRYDRSYYQNLIQSTADKIPDTAFTADVMVGYPTEEEADFRDTYELIHDLPIADLHVFKYSMRQGTRAALITPQVDEMEKHQRSERLIELGNQKKQAFISSMLGKTLTVVVERELSQDLYSALSDNYIDIVFKSRQDLRGKLVNVTLTAVGENNANGELCIR